MNIHPFEVTGMFAPDTRMRILAQPDGQIVFAGQLIGGLVLAGITGWSFANRFWLGAGIVALSFVVVWFTTAGVSQRLKDAMAQETTTAPDGGRKKIGRALQDVRD